MSLSWASRRSTSSRPSSASLASLSGASSSNLTSPDRTQFVAYHRKIRNSKRITEVNKKREKQRDDGWMKVKEFKSGGRLVR